MKGSAGDAYPVRDESDGQWGITFVHRKKKEFWSVEGVFESIRNCLARRFRTREVMAPVGGGRPGAVGRNLRWVSKLKGDLFHVTGDIHYAILGLGRRPSVLTIHDLRFLEEARGLKRILLWLFWLYLPCRWADRVTVISEETRKKVVRAGRVPSKKVRVIANPLFDVFHRAERAWPSEAPVCLHVGTTENKNLERVVKAVKGVDVRLRVLGRLSDPQAKMLVEAPMEVEHFSDLSWKEVAKLYAESDLILFPSLYEGFGLPIIEGQAVGRPVLTSDRSPMREVAGGGALLVDPESVESIQAGIARLTEDEDLRKDLVTKGFENVKKYRPEAIAAQYADLYREVYEEWQEKRGRKR